MNMDYKLLSDQFESILDHLPALVFYKDRENRFIHVNQYVADAYNRPKHDLKGVSLFDLTSREEAEKYHRDDLEVMEKGIAKLNIEEPWNTRNGLRWVCTSKIPFVDDHGKIIGVIGISTDITERKRADERIKELIHKLAVDKDFAEKNSLTDSLTRIPNRRHFDERLAREFFRIKRTGGLLSLIIIDIDHFKKYNDFYGHLAGDECLFRVATAIKSAVFRPSDFSARYGGEEFVALLPDTDGEGAQVIADRILKDVVALNIPHEHSDHAACVTVSLGIATARPDHLSTPESLVLRADKALYEAKKNGRNRYAVGGYETNASSEDQGFMNLVWHNSNKCGNPIIDSQHENLYKLSNRLIYFISNGKEKTQCSTLLKNLLHDIQRHFQDEETLLDSVRYPLTEEHRHIHGKLLTGAHRLIDAFNSDELKIEDLIKYIAVDVILEHLIIEDKKYFHFLE